MVPKLADGSNFPNFPYFHRLKRITLVRLQTSTWIDLGRNYIQIAEIISKLHSFTVVHIQNLHLHQVALVHSLFTTEDHGHKASQIF